MRFAKVLVLVATWIVALPLLAQQPAPSQQPMPMPPGHSMQMPMQHGSEAGKMSPECQAMMQKMQSMHASQEAMDTRLTALVDDMNKAKGSAKVDRMAAVINELVSQRKQMRDAMAAMMPEMMNHMMQHMQSGMTSSMQSMSGCPMMSGAHKPSPSANPEHKH